MKEREYFLRLENATKAWFEIIAKDIKIFVSSQMPARFQKISNETESCFCGATPWADKDALQNKYADYDVFYLNISEIDNWERSKETRFELSDKPDIVAALVCVPKNDPEYKEQPKEHIDFIRITLENYYNDANNWYILVMDKHCENLRPEEAKDYYKYVVEDHLLCAWDDDIGQKDKDFFRKCQNEYGIPRSEINLAKKIIRSHKQLKRFQYSITPEIIKILRDQCINNTKTPMALPITLDKKGFRQDLYVTKHFLINGPTGMGKTTLLKLILKSIDHQPKNANCKIVLIDTKDFDFNGCSSEYLMTPVITNAEKAAEYLSKIQSPPENIAIVIDDLADLIAGHSDIQDVLIKLSEDPKIHIIVAISKIDKLTCGFMDIFHGRVIFNGDKVGEYQYFSKRPYKFDQFYKKRSVL